MGRNDEVGRKVAGKGRGLNRSGGKAREGDFDMDVHINSYSRAEEQRVDAAGGEKDLEREADNCHETGEAQEPRP